MSFDEAMYERIREGCKQSAHAVVPWVYDRVRPQTVIDVGGGEGWWAREFVDTHWKSREPRGHINTQPFEPMRAWVVDESIGQHRQVVVGDPLIGTIDFLNHPPTFEGPRYDLAVCLEVVEHAEPDVGLALVESLCLMAPVVLFSAAIPGQGGHGHVNEQWPQYWASAFRDHGYAMSETIRDAFWYRSDVEPWYRQNLLMAGEVSTLTSMGLAATYAPRAVVHPDIYGWRLQERDALQERIDDWRESALEDRDRE